MSSSPPEISQTPPPAMMATATTPVPKPSASPAASPLMPSSTLSVPKATPTKPSRQATYPDKTTGAGSSAAAGGGVGSAYANSNPYAGLPSGLPAALNLSPGTTMRLGSRSPSSIPSSPTSIHSSSSAIFERDIESLGLPSLSVPLSSPNNGPVRNPSRSGSMSAGAGVGVSPAAVSPTAIGATNSHRIPRSKTTEAIDLTVPSVLDSAVSALSIAEETGTSITVLSPAPSATQNMISQALSGSAMQSPLSMHSQSSPLSSTFAQAQQQPSTSSAAHGIGSLGSVGSGTSGGSPSPPTMSLLLQGMGMSGLVSASASVSGAASASGGVGSGIATPLSSSRAPSPARSASPPVINTISEQAPPPSISPKSTTREVAPQSTTAGTIYTPAPSSPLKRPSLPPTAPSPSMRATNRLSFISYTDLLTSAPIASQPLSAVLSPGPNEPPTHLVVVDAENVAGTGMTPATSSGNLPLDRGIGSLNVGGPADKVDVDSLGTVGLSTTGEWGREGLGGGLEERLERLWAAEKELNERGRVVAPVARLPSRSTSMAKEEPSATPAPPLSSA